MTLIELKNKIIEENLNEGLLFINDSRIRKLYDHIRAPYFIILNRTVNNTFEVFIHDERGYKIISKENMTEEQACDATLIALRENTKIVEEIQKEINKNYNRK